ncbi:MAG: stalk domain-containing protein [Caldisericia bacterium]
MKKFIILLTLFFLIFNFIYFKKTKSFINQNEEVVFFDDFENGLKQWKVIKEDGVDIWSISKERFVSPVQSLKNTQNPIYGSFANTTITSKSLNIEGFTNLYIEFYYWSLFEGFYDKVEFFATGLDNGKIINHEFEQSTNANWKILKKDLTPILKGNTKIIISFKFTSDINGTAAGFYVDDVKIYGLKKEIEVKVPKISILDIQPSINKFNFVSGNKIFLKTKISYSDSEPIANKEIQVYDPTSNAIIKAKTDKDGILNYTSQNGVYIEGIYNFVLILDNQKFNIDIPVLFSNKTYNFIIGNHNIDFEKIKIINEKAYNYKFNINDYINIIENLFYLIVNNFNINKNMFFSFTSQILNNNFESSSNLILANYDLSTNSNFVSNSINILNKINLNASIKSKYIDFINKNLINYIIFLLPIKNESFSNVYISNKLTDIINNLKGTNYEYDEKNDKLILTAYDSNNSINIILLPQVVPDLSIKQVLLSSSEISYGDDLNLSITIENIGNIDSGKFDVTILIDNVINQEKEIYNLKPNMSTDLNLTISKLSPGEHKLKIYVDYKNFVNEQNESNNSLIYNITVISLPSIPKITRLEQQENRVYIKWEPSIKGTYDIKGYEIYKDNQLISKIENPNLTEYYDNEVKKGISYCYKIRSYDVKLNYSNFSDISCIEVKKKDPPNLILNYIPDETYEKIITISGKVFNTQILYINDNVVDFKADGTFNYNYKLSEGINIIRINLIGYDDQNFVKEVKILFLKETVITLQIGNKIIYVNGNLQEIDVPPQIIEGRTLIPIKWVIEPLGGVTLWDPIEKKVTINLKNIIIELWIGKNIAKVNGNYKPIDSNNLKVVPLIIDGRTMLPLRFVAESLGADVQWDGTTKTITITYIP